MGEPPLLKTVKKTLADVMPAEVIERVRAMKRDKHGRYVVALRRGDGGVCCPIGACYVATHGPDSADPNTWVPWWPSTSTMTGTDEGTRHIPKAPFDTPERRDVAVAVIRAFDAARDPGSTGDRRSDWTVVPVEVLA